MKKTSLLLFLLFLLGTTSACTSQGVTDPVAPAPSATQEYTPMPEPEPTPKPTPVPIEQVTIKPLELREGMANPYALAFGSPFDASGALSTKSIGWGYFNIENHQPPSPKMDFDIRMFDAYHLGDITQKNIYLTFDEGYEYGFTPAILDTLKEKGVHAAFFLTKDFVKDQPDLVKRMVSEGHVIANHSCRHKNSSTLSDDELKQEIIGLEDYVKEATGCEIAPFFRPPGGDYSAHSLEVIRQLGYKTIFWSLHHYDYDVNKQPGKEATFQKITEKVHNGCILLLHAVSESNMQTLPDMIDWLLENGYTFKSLYDLPENI